MADDLFAGFSAGHGPGDGAEIFYRVGGAGPPVVLLHGYPQTHAMWHRVAPALAEHFTVVAMDLRGYGASSCPEPDDDHFAYSKRAMGRDVAALMAALGHDRFAVVGHDRGGRVAYRLALDAPARVSRLAVLDIVPTHAVWHGMDARGALRSYQWLLLAQPHPLPEMLIEPVAVRYLDATLGRWGGSDGLSRYDPRALDAYRESFARPANIRAACEDYRAGATFDLAADEADRAAGRKISCPVLAVWGASSFPAAMARGPLETWRDWGDEVSGGPIDSGHFIAEESPDELLARLLPFLRDA
jgi:haloacetate dehalogenase